MSDIKTEFQLLLELNRIIANQISDSVIVQLKKLTDKHFLNSGDDSGLINVWEEICVQVQGEGSYYWDAYKDTIENYIKAELINQPEGIKILISYIGGIEESTDNESDEYSYNEEYAINEIMHTLLSKAGSYENENITRFLEQDFEDDDELEEDEEEDDKKPS